LSLEAVKEIAAAEEKAKNDRLNARRKAELAVANAEAAGSAAVENAKRKAAEECAEMLKTAESESSDNAALLFENTANKCAIIRARAESRFDKAAAFIAGRIVRN
jgi:vacuolar-type H+-ATPase subunit H